MITGLSDKTYQSCKANKRLRSHERCSVSHPCHVLQSDKNLIPKSHHVSVHLFAKPGHCFQCYEYVSSLNVIPNSCEQIWSAFPCSWRIEIPVRLLALAFSVSLSPGSLKYCEFRNCIWLLCGNTDVFCLSRGCVIEFLSD